MMPRDTEPRDWIGRLVLAVQCYAVLRLGGGSGTAQHSTATTNCRITIQCLGSGDLMSLGIKSSATEGIATKHLFKDFIPALVNMSPTTKACFRYVFRNLVPYMFDRMSTTKVYVPRSVFSMLF